MAIDREELYSALDGKGGEAAEPAGDDGDMQPFKMLADAVKKGDAAAIKAAFEECYEHCSGGV